ncbi:MAG TPA: hypothetical protein VK972_01085, partial [Wenzhouxiangella sp.]|nr:hypothetical protein [Wenzhouxiangella sp.]
SEILYVAGLHWQHRLRDLDDAALWGLAAAAHGLMWRSAETGGLTNDPDRIVQLEHAGWPRRDYRHYVFNRDGQVCHACNTPIERISVSGRRLYCCPSCQARRRAF